MAHGNLSKIPAETHKPAIHKALNSMSNYSPINPPIVIASSRLPDIAATSFDVVVLPWGATEAHGTHLPYATDNAEVETVAAAAAKLAWDAGAKVAVLPGIPFGVQTGQLDIPFCINLNPSTQAIILGDILASLAATKVRKFVLLNGHGGNDFRQILRELQPRFPNLFLSTMSWFTAHDGRGIIDVLGDHADERETSLMLHLQPDLVAPRDTWGKGTSNAWTLAALRDKSAWAPRHWTLATNDTGVGDPGAATADKGKRYFAAICERVAAYFVELAKADLSQLYEQPK
jgi:creatinine amidohydrolase